MNSNLRRVMGGVREQVVAHGHGDFIEPYGAQSDRGPVGFQVTKGGYRLRWYVLTDTDGAEGVLEFVLFEAEGEADGASILTLDYSSDGPSWSYVVHTDEDLLPMFDFIQELEVEVQSTGRGPDLNWYAWNELLRKVIEAFTASTD